MFHLGCRTQKINPSPQRRRRLLVYLGLLVVLSAFFLVTYRGLAVRSLPERSLDSLLAALRSEQVAAATFKADGIEVEWQDTQGNRYRTFYPLGYQLVDRFELAGAKFKVEPTNIWLTVILPNAILFLIIGAFFMLRKAKTIT